MVKMSHRAKYLGTKSFFESYQANTNTHSGTTALLRPQSGQQQYGESRVFPVTAKNSFPNCLVFTTSLLPWSLLHALLARVAVYTA